MALDNGVEPLFGFNLQQKKSLMQELNALGTSAEQAAAIAGIPALTNNSAGTADNTVAAMPAATAATTDTSAASLASVNTSLTAIRNNIADLTVKVNAILAALKL